MVTERYYTICTLYTTRTWVRGNSWHSGKIYCFDKFNRSKWTRWLCQNIEHHTDAVTMSARSHMLKQWMLDPPESNMVPNYRFSVVSQYEDALSRQTGEAMRIMSTNNKILNSKCEYLSNYLSRISVQETDLGQKQD